MKSVDEYCRLIRRYQLLSSADFAAMRSRWFRAGRPNVTDPAEFCRWLVLNHYATDFVVQALSGDHPEQLVMNQYRLHDHCSSGPYAGAYIAVDPLHRFVALRIRSPGSVADPAALRAIVEVTHRLMEVHQPNVVRTLDIGQAHGRYYLASEYHEGTSLAEVLKKRGKLPYIAAARLMTLASDGLEALHENGVAGGDLAADCLLLVPAGSRGPGEFTVKLLYPGLTRGLFDSEAPDSQGHSILPGELRLADSGTAPRLDAQSPQPAEELFRLGRVFYRTVTGQDPFTAEDLAGPIHSARPVAELARDVPAMLAEIVESMIDRNPAHRPQRAAHVAKSLRVFLAAEESAREHRAEDHIVPRVRHALVHAEDPDVGEHHKKSRHRHRRRLRLHPPPSGFVEQMNRLWEEYQPQERDLIFFALGPVGFILLIMAVKLVTGWSVENIIWLVAGICISFFVERLLKWREAREAMKDER